MFDFSLLVVSYLQVVLELLPFVTDSIDLEWADALRSLRVLRGVSFSSNLQVLILALKEAVTKHVFNLLMMLMIVLFLFGLSGYFLFHNVTRASDDKHWESLKTSMFTMVCIGTADSWNDPGDSLINEFHDGWGGRLFAVIFVCVGNMYLSNILVGIICYHIDDITNKYESHKKRICEQQVRLRKESLRRKYLEELQQCTVGIAEDFEKSLTDFRHQLRHDDFVSKSDVLTDPKWINRVYKTASNYQDICNDLLYLHCAMAENLHKIYKKRIGDRYVEPITDPEFQEFVEYNSGTKTEPKSTKVKKDRQLRITFQVDK